ncbi:glycosyltransferase family 4 protein [Pontibacter amylolyticus]|uniref:Glycosyl transferase n=1 Tax=Pontibacter amylolyticus TaxID=1424080 RepID=A0ABQ1WCS4_9BACT|nr:glycosyltransferase family 4 protein [Pontibacter amylolyticus]GGG25384.1 glycosyl transferase [Pontibacter amylolyticus]
MKVLFVQKEGGIFGAENYQLKIIPSLLKKGITIEFLRLYTKYQGGKGGAFIEKLNSLGVKTYEINIGKYPSFPKLKAIKNIIEEGQYDLVHTHLIHADFYLSLTKVFFSLPCKWVSTKHGYDNEFTSQYGFDPSKQKLTPYFLISRFAEKRNDKSYTISHGLRNFFTETGLAKANKMELIHYGFDFPEVTEAWIDNKFRMFKKQVVIAGRLIKFKGHSKLIEAISESVKKDSEIGLVIVGSGILEEELKQQVKMLQIESNVHFTGYSTEVIKYMYNSDLVAVPSISEGFGVVFLEAFNCKKPVVAFDVPSGNELMIHKKTGYLVPAYDIQALGNQIVEIFSDQSEANKVGANAYRQLIDYYNLDRMVDETINFYQGVI